MMPLISSSSARHLTGIVSATLATLSLGVGAGCSKSDAEPDADESARFDFRVGALNLEGVNGVVYGIIVTTNDGQTVWSRADLDSTRFGDGVGAISYVGPCDATPSSNPHQIALTLVEMRTNADTVIAPSTYQNPAPADAPIVVSANCVENADTPVVINLTIMRNAQQGFFDVGVNFDNIFCSAKFDCMRNDAPFQFLHNPSTGQRDFTVILGFSCTTGSSVTGEGTPTWMHLSNVLVQCEGEGGQTVQLLMDPSGPEGNNGGAPPLFYQTGIYRGQEDLEPYDKCYWNMAFGINLGESSGLTNCRFLAQGTASQEPFGPTGATPEATVYPYVSWDITLTDGDGNLDCNVHPLNGTGDEAGVSTQYTDWSGTSFTHEWECDDTAEVTTNALACNGLTETGTSVAFEPQPSGLTVRFGNSLATGNNEDNLLAEKVFELPEGYSFGSDTYCCVNPCCDTQTP